MPVLLATTMRNEKRLPVSARGAQVDVCRKVAFAAYGTVRRPPRETSICATLDPAT